jgi:hypothetical protein
MFIYNDRLYPARVGVSESKVRPACVRTRRADESSREEKGDGCLFAIQGDRRASGFGRMLLRAPGVAEEVCVAVGLKPNPQAMWVGRESDATAHEPHT